MNYTNYILNHKVTTKCDLVFATKHEADGKKIKTKTRLITGFFFKLHIYPIPN